MNPHGDTFHGLLHKVGRTSFYIWFFWFFSSANSSSLMSQIREKQEGNQLSKGIQLPLESWMTVPRVLQDALTSIDDKLKSLDTFGYTLKLAKLDFSLEQLVRRLDNIETKLGRLDTKFDLRMEKVEEVVLGKDLKEEFSNEHLVRRMENLHEKFNSKATFIEAKIDVRMDHVGQKLDALEKDVHASVEEILERMVKSNERQVIFENQVLEKLQNIEQKQKDFNLKDELLNTLEERISNVENKYEEHSTAMDQVKTQIYSSESLQNAENIKQVVENSMQDIKLYINGSACFNSLTENKLRAMLKSREYEDNFESDEKLEKINVAVYKTLNLSETKFKKLDSDMELYSKKVIHSVQELWKSQDHHRGLLNSFLRQGDETKTLLNKTLQDLRHQLSPLSIMEPHLTDLNTQLPKKLTDLSTAIDSSFATLLVAQNTFISTCRRIQLEESHVYDILKEVVYEMRNRSIVDMQRVVEEIQNMNFNLGGKLNNMLEAIFTIENATVNREGDLCNFNKSLLNFPNLASNFIHIQRALSKLSTRFRKSKSKNVSLPHENFNDGNISIPTSEVKKIEKINVDLAHVDELKADSTVNKSKELKSTDNMEDNSYYDY